MKDLLDKLSQDEIQFVCDFANNFITQIPYIDKTNVDGLDRDYFIKTLKRRIKNKKIVFKQEANIINSILHTEKYKVLTVNKFTN